MKRWIETNNSMARPYLFIDDSPRHHEDFCKTMARIAGRRADEMFELGTLVMLHEPGLDGQIRIVSMLADYPTLQISGGPYGDEFLNLLKKLDRWLEGEEISIDEPYEAELLEHRSVKKDPCLAKRFLDMPPQAQQEKDQYTRYLDSLIRPGGIMISDTQLDYLPFLESDMFAALRSASEACSQQADSRLFTSAAQLQVFSNKGKFNMNVGSKISSFASTAEIMDKDEPSEIVQTLVRESTKRFPWALLRTGFDKNSMIHHVGPEDKDYINQTVDLCIWETGGNCEVGGTLIEGNVKRRDPNTAAWRFIDALYFDYIGKHEGIENAKIHKILVDTKQNTDVGVFKSNRRRELTNKAIVPAGRGGSCRLPNGITVCKVTD